MKRRFLLATTFGMLVLAWALISARAEPVATRAVRFGSSADSLRRTLPIRPQALQFPGGAASFEQVNERIARTLLDGEGSFRVVHLGGSHVQAGWMGDRVRERWWEMAETACSRGLILPYRMAGTNTPPRVRTEFTGSWTGSGFPRTGHPGPLGGVGLSAATFDDAATWWHVAIRADSTAYRTAELRVLAESNGWVPRWAGRDTSVRVERTLLDSSGGWLLTFDPPVDTLFLGLEEDTIEVEGARWFRLHGVVAEDRSCPCEGLVYHEIGNNGASTASALRGSDDAGFGRDWRALQPDLVIFGLGINDAHAPVERFDPEAFIARYDSLVQLIRAAAPETAFMYLTNTDSFYGRRPNPAALAVREALFELARKQGAAVFDQFDAMGGLGAIQVWRDAGYAQSDLIHFTRSGYRVLADLYWDALLGNWAKSHAIQRRRIHLSIDTLPDRSEAVPDLPANSLIWNS